MIRKRVGKEPRRDKRRFYIIRDTTSALISSMGSHELFQVIVDNAKEISGAKFVSLSFFDEDKSTIKLGALSGPEPSLLRKLSGILKIENLFRHEFPVSKCPSFQEFLKKKVRKPIILNGFHEYTFGLFDKRICSLIEKIAGFKEIVAIPLLKNEKLEGILGYLFHTKEKRDFTLLLIFADLVSQTLEKSKIENRIRMEREVYRSISRAASRSRTVEDLCELALKGIRRAIKYDMADVLVYRESENALFSVAQFGYPEDLYRRIIKRQDLKEKSRVAAQAVRERKSIYIDDTKTSKLTSYAQDLIAKYDISTLYVVPLFSRGKLQGVLEVLTTGGKRLSKEDREVLDTISEELAGGITKAKIEEQLVTVKEAFGWISV